MTKYINQRYFDQRQRTEKEKRAMYYVLGASFGSYKPIETKQTLKDGSITTLEGVQFKSPHKKLVEIIHNELESEHTITSDPRYKESHWFEVTGVPTLYERLEQLGLNVPKPEREFPQDIPKKYLSDFVRGFFDSKGHFLKRKNKIGFGYGFYEKFLLSQHEFFKRLGVQGGSSSNSYIEYGQHDAEILSGIMYRGWHRKRRLHLPENKILFDPDYRTEYNDQLYGRADERIEEGKKLLAKGRLVREVAIELGYRKIESFSTRFKIKTGQTPSEFKALNVGN